MEHILGIPRKELDSLTFSAANDVWLEMKLIAIGFSPSISEFDVFNFSPKFLHELVRYKEFVISSNFHSSCLFKFIIAEINYYNFFNLQFAFDATELMSIFPEQIDTVCEVLHEVEPLDVECAVTCSIVDDFSTDVHCTFTDIEKLDDAVITVDDERPMIHDWSTFSINVTEYLDRRSNLEKFKNNLTSKQRKNNRRAEKHRASLLCQSVMTDGNKLVSESSQSAMTDETKLDSEQQMTKLKLVQSEKTEDIKLEKYKEKLDPFPFCLLPVEIRNKIVDYLPCDEKMKMKNLDTSLTVRTCTSPTMYNVTVNKGFDFPPPMMQMRCICTTRFFRKSHDPLYLPIIKGLLLKASHKLGNSRVVFRKVGCRSPRVF